MEYTIEMRGGRECRQQRGSKDVEQADLCFPPNSPTGKES